MNRIAAGLTIYCLFLATTFASAQEKIVVDDPAKIADPDFAVQGEYVGEVNTGGGGHKVGVQVIALGKGKFRAARYLGGLPGDGWDRSDARQIDGETFEGDAWFKSDNVIGKLRNGVIRVFNADGVACGELKRVERKSPTIGAKPPAGAVVLFDGTNADAWEKGRMTTDNLLMCGVTSKQTFGSCSLHLEFRTPYQPQDSGQARGNSGCYLQGRYEVQILDSFGLAGKNNECGGLYEIRDPDVNMCFPPLAWQTYDIDYTAAVYDADGKKTKNATITVRHNGVVVQQNAELPRATRAAPVPEGPTPGPLYLQNHSNPVVFRNVWVVAK